MRIMPAVLAVAALLASAPAEPAHTRYPSSIIALGDSGSTGFNSDRPGVDAEQNSWATGESPAVNSHYLRLLSANPKIRNHNLSYAKDGARMRDLLVQARVAASLNPGYVTSRMGGNDLCRSDEPTLAAFRAQLVAGLRELARGAPNARILVVGLGKFSPLVDVIKAVPAARAVYSDGSPCDPQFNAAGEPNPQRVAFADAKIASFNAQLASGCAAFVHCRYDGASVDSEHLELADLSSDYGHASVQGLAKDAAATWAATFDFTDRTAPTSRAVRSGRKISLTAADAAGVAGIEYRLVAKGPWTRYTKPVTVPEGKTLTWRAVDVNGNCEATHSLKV
jgi:lysophospholipase L1-like esterase